MSDSNDIGVNRSGFVTGLAWTFIALAGQGTLIAVLQNIMFTVMFDSEELGGIVRRAEGTRPIRAVFRFMFEYFRFFLLGFLLVSAATLVAAIGLLERKNWARLMFVGIMALGVMWSLTSAMLIIMMDSRDSFRPMGSIMTGFTVVMGLALAVLFGWIIKRLVSREVEREFLAP